MLTADQAVKVIREEAYDAEPDVCRAIIRTLGRMDQSITLGAAVAQLQASIDYPYRSPVALAESIIEETDDQLVADMARELIEAIQ